MTCKEGNVFLIKQIITLIRDLGDDRYTKEMQLLHGSTIGKHVRHIYEFYESVLKAGVQSLLDYNDRNRDELIENITSHTEDKFMELIRSMQKLDESKILFVVTDFDPDCDEDRCQVQSSVGRELMYAYDHAVHHLAIIKMGIKHEYPKFDFDKNLGIAPSTIKYNNFLSSK